MTDSHHHDPAPAPRSTGRQRLAPTPGERSDKPAQRQEPVGGGEAVAATDPAAELAAVRAELEEKTQQYLRLAADFENYRRRAAQETSDRVRYASEAAVLALLPVLDNLRRAVEHAGNGADASLLEGVRLTLRQFEEALATLGVTQIPTVGEPFDPAVHEAVVGEESPEVDRDLVVGEIQRGYRLHDRVLRPALVKVAHPA